MPRFSVDHLDRAADPTRDFNRFANGGWIERHPVPADKSRWGGFGELLEMNLGTLHEILDEAGARARDRSSPVRRLVGAFYASAMDTKEIERRRFAPIREGLDAIRRIRTRADLVRVLAHLHDEGVGALFVATGNPDKKDSSVYALYLLQGGLALPDREYYLAPAFAPQRRAYRGHLVRMFRQLGRTPRAAERAAKTVLEFETSLAEASRSRTDLRDDYKNYNRVARSALDGQYPELGWARYLRARRVPAVDYAIVGQPEFLARVDELVAHRPLDEWKTYLTWQLLHAAAPFLHDAVEREDFAFFHRRLLGQQRPEPRWKRAARVIDAQVGEALGQLYVERCFPPEAKARMDRLVADLREVFRDRLQALDWMSAETRERAVAKFDRFTAKIGHPERFRDYSSVRVAPDDYAGNVQRAGRFEVRRKVDRIGRPVDRTEWRMTPPTVNAYFDSSTNEIVFPAGILQPPFFDVTMDDAVNYGGIGVVIGHEITHGYDDRGRRYDADGNLKDWWTERDATEFTQRAERVVEEYNGFEPLPGVHVNGALTLGENIADFGGVSIAYEALQRRLAKDPAQRRPVDGFSPEQRFFLSYAQIWRETCREPELRRLLTVDSHSPGRYRAVGPLLNFPPFWEAFHVEKGAPMRRPDDRLVSIW